VKSTLHGVSAAAGKLGAIAGTLLFPYILEGTPDPDVSLVAIMHACGFAALLGAAVTWYGTPRMTPTRDTHSDEVRLTRPSSLL
jgi:predicted lysophospholipase L1 biosynthesis ABC-type transport system permease subunit